jgi:hypothetical protein
MGAKRTPTIKNKGSTLLGVKIGLSGRQRSVPVLEADDPESKNKLTAMLLIAVVGKRYLRTRRVSREKARR